MRLASIPIAILAMLAFGCNKPDDPLTSSNASPPVTPSPAASPTNRPKPPLASIAVVLGIWKPDLESITMTFADKSPKVQAVLPQAIADVKKNMKAATLTFKDDGTYATVDGTGTKDTGTYSVSGKIVKMVDDKHPKAPQPKVTLKGKRLFLHMDQGGNTLDMQMVKS